MSDVVLALNAGSSSIKFSLFAVTGSQEERALAVLFRGEIEGIGGGENSGNGGPMPRFWVQDARGDALVDKPLATRGGRALDHEQALGMLLQWIEGHDAGLTLVGAGHRVVHGGRFYTAPTLVDGAVLRRLDELI